MFFHLCVIILNYVVVCYHNTCPCVFSVKDFTATLIRAIYKYLLLLLLLTLVEPMLFGNYSGPVLVEVCDHIACPQYTHHKH